MTYCKPAIAFSIDGVHFLCISLEATMCNPYEWSIEAGMLGFNVMMSWTLWPMSAKGLSVHAYTLLYIVFLCPLESSGQLIFVN
jgi:hypothetical protein